MSHNVLQVVIAHRGAAGPPHGRHVSTGLRAVRFRQMSARHRIRHGIRHTAARAGRRSCPCVANGRLRYMLIGDARVSTADGSPSLAVQRDARQAAGVDAGHVDVASGVRDARPGLDRCLLGAATLDLYAPSGFPPVRQGPSANARLGRPRDCATGLKVPRAWWPANSALPCSEAFPQARPSTGSAPPERQRRRVSRHVLPVPV